MTTDEHITALILRKTIFISMIQVGFTQAFPVPPHCTVQRTLEVQIVHATRTSTCYKLQVQVMHGIYIFFEERSPQISSIRDLRLSENVSLSTSMTADNHCLMYSNE